MERDRLKVLIVDNEKKARHLLRRYLKNIPHIDLVEESECAGDALYKIIALLPDMIFLDIMMPERNGAELMELLVKKKSSCHLVILSRDENSAIPAIKNNVYDLLLKPVSKEDVEKVVDKFLERRNDSLDEKLIRILKKVDDGRKIRLTSINNHTLVDPADIVYCEADGSYTTIYLENGTKEMANNYLGMIEKRLSGYRFYRISRSYLINLDRLSKINKGDYTCILAYGKKKVKLQGAKKQLKILSEMDFE